MIAKGTAHNNGAKLASYMTTGKKGERAELWELRGFEATGIKDAFRDVQIMAGATKCQQPFFHVQVRNPEGETLTRHQWEIAATRIERMLGLTDQPRAIAFHIDEKTGEEHMHVAWSRIDESTLTAKELPFFKDRLKKISRELELHFGLTVVTSRREGSIKYAPTRAEQEQARRLGLDIHEVRNTIRDCYDRSNCGVSFQAALADERLILAQGDRRDFVVIDHEGGMHVLSKRILDVPAAEIRARLSDLAREELPTVENARAFVAEVRQEKQHDKSAPVWDRDRAEREWQDAIISAAIEKEKIARQFVEPRDRENETRAKCEQTQPGSREEKQWPVNPPQPERKAPGLFETAATEATRDNRAENLKGPAEHVWTTWLQSDNAQAFAAALDDRGIAFAAVTREEANRSHREAEFAKAIGNHSQRFKEGEIVIVTEPHPEYRRNGDVIEQPRVHKIEQSLAHKFVRGLGNGTELQGIDATLKASDDRAQKRAAHWQAVRLENATNIKDLSNIVAQGIKSPAAALGRAAGVVTPAIGKTLEVIGSMVESLAAPKLTPQQIQEGENAKERREAEAESAIDFSRFTSDLAQQRQQQENTREAERRTHRERDGGGRER